MVKTWLMNCSKLTDSSIYDLYYEQLPIFRKQKVDLLKTDLHKRQSVAAWILWCKIKDKYNLPENPIFNLSHSGEYSICSVFFPTVKQQGNPVKVGCDIERINHEVNYEKLMIRYFHTEEIKHFNQIRSDYSEQKKRIVFYRYWVLKESFLKATKKGMGLDTRSFACYVPPSITSGEQPYLLHQPKEYPEVYYFREFALEQEYRIAVCSTSGDIRGVSGEFKL